MPSAAPIWRARWDLPLPPQPMIAIRSTGREPIGAGRARGGGIGEPFQEAVEGGDLAGEAEDAQAVQACGQELGVARGSRDGLGILDTVDDLLPVGGVQGWRGEGTGARDGGR